MTFADFCRFAELLRLISLACCLIFIACIYDIGNLNNDNLLLKNNKVILSPHSATFTNECKSRMSIETTKNIIDFFGNKIDKSMIVKL